MIVELQVYLIWCDAINWIERQTRKARRYTWNSQTQNQNQPQRLTKPNELNNPQRLTKPNELNNANKPRHQAPAKIQMNSIL